MAVVERYAMRYHTRTLSNPTQEITPMKIPASAHFTPRSLSEIFNVDRQTLPASLQPGGAAANIAGDQALLGMPFLFGAPGALNVILLDKTAVSIDMADCQATYVLFLHAVEDR